MDETYVLNHDFGYGKEEETNDVNRLNLRNIKDVETYVLDIIKNAMVCASGKYVALIDSAKIEKVHIELF